LKRSTKLGKKGKRRKVKGERLGTGVGIVFPENKNEIALKFSSL
jgi:hypothetical protein